MNQVVWKFPIFVSVGETIIPLPEQAKILCVQTQGEQPYIWALVDVNSPKVDRIFRIYPTGYYGEYPGVYIGTFQLHSGTFIGHLFEETTR